MVDLNSGHLRPAWTQESLQHPVGIDRILTRVYL